MRHFSTLVAAALLVTGCDSAFLQQIDIDRTSDTVVSISQSLDEEVSNVVRAYALEQELQCDSASGLPVRCALVPRQVFAFRTPGGITVCYASGGIPTEAAKNQALAKALEERLIQKFGNKRVLSTPMSHAWAERCKRGA